MYAWILSTDQTYEEYVLSLSAGGVNVSVNAHRCGPVMTVQGVSSLTVQGVSSPSPVDSWAWLQLVLAINVPKFCFVVKVPPTVT